MLRLRSLRFVWPCQRSALLIAVFAAACGGEQPAKPDAVPEQAAAPRAGGPSLRSSGLRVAADPTRLPNPGAPPNPRDAAQIAPPSPEDAGQVVPPPPMPDLSDDPPSTFCARICDASSEDGDHDDAGAGDEDGGPGGATPVAPARAVNLTHGPMLGAVTDRSIEVWARGDGPGRFAVHAWPLGDSSTEHCGEVAVFDPAARDGTAVSSLRGLLPGTVYGYRVEVADETASRCTATMSQVASFQTLPRENEPARVRFVVAADVRGTRNAGFADIHAVAPDFVLMIGDNVYADDNGYVVGDHDASFALAQALYHHVWGGEQFRALFAEVAAFMIWDDHEVMSDYWRGKHDLRHAVGRALYDAYQGSHNPAPLAAGELYYTFRAGDVGFFVLDTRSHRSSNMVPDDADKSMLGTAQRQAFEEWLAHDDSRVHVIVSSVLVGGFSTTGQDAWSAFATEREAWLEVIAAHGTANTFIVSGDQHWSAVMRLSHGQLAPYVLYEFQTTPLDARLRNEPQSPDDSVLALDSTHRVFGVFDVDTRAEPPELDFTLCAVGAPCAPHDEAAPMREGDGTAVPYSLHFIGGPRGFSLVSEP